MNVSKKKRRGSFLWALFAICILGHAPLPGPAKVFAASYDLLVIAPEEFAVPLNALVAHKNATGMPAVLLTLESVYRPLRAQTNPRRSSKPSGPMWNIHP
jgi:hypothetical protein